MTYTLHPLKTIPPNLLSRIAEIQLHDAGLLSQLGYAFVLKYFENAIKDEKAFGFYAQDDETKKIMGFSLASPEPSSLTSALTQDKVWFIKNILKVLFTKPITFFQMLISSITIQSQMDESNTIECVYFTVDPNFRGHRLGRALQKALMDEGKKRGYKKIFASVETKNIASLKATQANGFTIVKTIREGMYHRHRLESKL